MNYPAKNHLDEESSGEECFASGKKNWSEEFSGEECCDGKLSGKESSVQEPSANLTVNTSRYQSIH
jgi:hypothetical protein